MTQTYKAFYRRSMEDREGFWNEQAQLVHWHKPHTAVLDYSRPPFAKWFVGGQTNLCYNAVDRHLHARGEQEALVYISTETDEQRSLTFRELHAEVNRFAAAMCSLGVGKGDRVIIYMPMIAEACFAILACARIGAIHSVVFGGFASHSLATRIDDAKPKLIVSSDAGMRMGKVVPYKHLLDEAIRLSQHPPQHVILVNRGLDKAMPVTPGRDHDYALLRAKHLDAQVPVAWMESNRALLHLVHVWHDRKAQGRATRRGRVCGGAGGVHEVHLLRRRWRGHVHHLGHRLGRRAFVYHLRPTDRRHDHGDV